MGRRCWNTDYLLSRLFLRIAACFYDGLFSNSRPSCRAPHPRGAEVGASRLARLALRVLRDLLSHPKEESAKVLGRRRPLKRRTRKWPDAA